MSSSVQRGRNGKGAPWAQLLGVAWFLAKTAVFLFLYIWVRATLPRIRYDQLRALGIPDVTIRRWRIDGYLHRVLPRVYAVGNPGGPIESELATALQNNASGGLRPSATLSGQGVYGRPQRLNTGRVLESRTAPATLPSAHGASVVPKTRMSSVAVVAVRVRR